MFRWNDTFRSKRTDYFTRLPLQRFANVHKWGNLKPNLDREELIREIENFANIDEIKKEIVNSWIDETMREGRRDIYIVKYDDNIWTNNNLSDSEYIKEKLEPLIVDSENRHFVGNIYSGEFRLVRYEMSSGDLGRVISLYVCKYIYCMDENKGITKQIYPIVVDVLVDKGYVIAGAKTKSNLFVYDSSKNKLEDLVSTTVERQALSSINTCAQWLDVNIIKDGVDSLKHNLYCLLDSCTHTPQEIQSLIKSKEEEINKIRDMILNEICRLDEEYSRDVAWDVTNMVEKYFSMTYPNKKIFTKNREAYPIKLDATDQQYSKVQQTAGFEEPLQSKDIFFDNKKMLQKNKKCDSIKLCYQRKDSLYCSDRFNVQITVKVSCCIVKFFDYTVQEDIKNVLLSIIKNGQDK